MHTLFYYQRDPNNPDSWVACVHQLNDQHSNTNIKIAEDSFKNDYVLSSTMPVHHVILSSNYAHIENVYIRGENIGGNGT